MVKNILGALAMIVSFTASGSVSAEEKLIFATVNAESTRLSTEIFDDWAKRINKEGAGVVQIDVRHGFTLASPINFYDRVKNGVVPISFGALGAIGGQFPLTGVMELPFLFENSVEASVAYWRLYEEGYFDKEYADIVPLYVTAFPNLALHMSSPLKSLDNLGGASVTAGTRTIARVLEALGGAPLSISPFEAYEAIQRGTADGELVAWSAFTPLRVGEVTSYHVEAPLGAFFLMTFINRGVWDGLSEEAREIIMRNSGEEQTRKLAELVLDLDINERALAVSMGGHEIVSPNKSQLAAWEKATAQVTAQWVKETEGGAKLLSRFKELQAQVAEENAAQ